MSSSVSSSQEEPALTAKNVAKLVKRVVPALKEGKPVYKDKQLVTKEVDVQPSEVLSFAVYDGGRVNVVTIDGKKLQGRING